MIVYAHIYVPMEVDDKFEALRPAIRKHLPIDFTDNLEDELLEIYDETVEIHTDTLPDYKENWKNNYIKIEITEQDEEEEQILAQI